MEQQRERRAQQDDRADENDLLQLAHDHGAQDLAAQLELQPERHAARQPQAGRRVAPHKAGHAPDAGRGDHRHARQLEQQDRRAGQQAERRVQRLHGVSPLSAG